MDSSMDGVRLTSYPEYIDRSGLVQTSYVLLLPSPRIPFLFFLPSRLTLTINRHTASSASDQPAAGRLRGGGGEGDAHTHR